MGRKRFTSVRLFNSHLPIYLIGLSAVAHDQSLLNPSRTAWFEACLCQPTLRGLPSSSITATESPLLMTFVSCRTISVIHRRFKLRASRSPSGADAQPPTKPSCA